jgi:zinc transport system ATP-binding protein
MLYHSIRQLHDWPTMEFNRAYKVRSPAGGLPIAGDVTAIAQCYNVLLVEEAVPTAKSRHERDAGTDEGQKAVMDAGLPVAASLSEAVVSRGGRNILDCVDVSIGRGEIVTVMGPNGAGKSTLVKALLGLERLSSGTAYLAPNIRIAYSPQNYRRDAALPLSVSRLLTLTQAHPRDKIHAVLKELSIDNLLGAQVIRLSGGELQRVMLARALLRDPALLVLDEPTQNVDIAGAIEIYQIIGRQRARTGCSVLLVSHDLNLVLAATDRVYCVNGHICCFGKPEDVGRNPAFIRLFGDAASRTLAPYLHKHDHAHSP